MAIQLKQLLDIVYGLIVPFAQKVYEVSQMTISEIITAPRWQAIPDGVTNFILDTLDIGDVTLLSFMLTVGVTFYIAWTLATWLLNVLT